jgi:ribosomal protein S18 acetylase RimI-like enzyme
LILREAVEHELEYIKIQRLRSYLSYEQVLPEEHWKVLRESLSAEISSGAKVFVAEVENQMAGSVVLFPSQSKAYEWDDTVLEYPEVRMLVVAPEFRKKGIAQALVQQCIDFSKEKGYPFIGLHTAKYMEGAIQLYKKVGFERIPALDFEPLDDGIVVEAYRLAI